MSKRHFSHAKRLSNAVGKHPVWLKTVAIAKPNLKPAPVRGTFGAASECVHIDPTTGEPRNG